MKNKSLILSIVFWFVTTVLMAVSLPSSPYYRGATRSAETFQTQVGTGVSINGYSLVGTASDESTDVCTGENPQDVEPCRICCRDNVLMPCLDENPSDPYLCGQLNTDCIMSCTNGSSLPLDAPVFFLLMMIAAYGAVVVYRRKTASV